MSGLYEDQVKEIQLRIDLVDLVAESIELKRKGNRYWGLCPFHQEKTPSFSVSPAKQMYYCFGCNQGGDVFSYLMQRDGLDFKEAIAVLAERTGVVLDPGRRNDNKQKNIVYAINKVAARYFRQQLGGKGKEALEAWSYILQRGISNEAIEVFQIGYATNSWEELGRYLLKQGFTAKELLLAGLTKEGKNNRLYDVFRNRIIFPIWHYNGDIIGFGGRGLSEDNIPKYLNSPETSVFSKRNNLYGLYQAKNEIRRSNEAILVEGYIDCITLSQINIKNVVASLGTAFTAEQARLLHRYAEKAVIIFDGDEAGQRETLKTIGVLLDQGIQVEVVSLPYGQDPNDFVQSYGKEEFYSYIQNNKDTPIAYKIKQLLAQEKNLEMAAVKRIIHYIKPDIIALNSPVEKDHYIKMLAQKLRVEENLLYREVHAGDKTIAADHDTKQNNRWENRNHSEQYSIQERLLATMLQDEKIFTWVKNEIGLNFFSDLHYKKIALLYDQPEDYLPDRLDHLKAQAGQQGLNHALAKLLFLLEEDCSLEAFEIKDIIERIKLLKSEAQYNKLLNQVHILQETGDFYQVLRLIIAMDRFLNKIEEGGGK